MGPNMRPYLRVANVYEDRIDISDVMEMNFSPAEVALYELQPGDILLNEGQSRELVGRPAMYRGELPGVCFTNSLVRFKCSEAILPQYSLLLFRHYLRSGEFQKIAQITTNIAHLGAGRFASLEIPVAPLNEQRRIVEKVEALLARSQRARKALDAIPPLLDSLRQSILAAAFRGDLTADWRAQHPDVEPAEHLLARIRTERRHRWEQAELATMHAKGKPPKDDKWKARYQEPITCNHSGTPDVTWFTDLASTSWTWAPLESLCDPIRGIPYGIVQTGENQPGGVPTVRCGDIKKFRIDISKLKQVESSVSEQYLRTILQGGEVLLAIRGTVGCTAVVDSGMRGMNISREVAMIPLLPGIEPYYLMYLLACPAGQRLLIHHVKGVAQSGINLSDLRAVPVPIPSTAEQVAIVESLEAKLAAVDKIERFLTASYEQHTILDQSILAKAFRGELVPQDPTDEPASALLERIRAAREAGEPARAGRGRKRPAAPPRSRRAR